MDAIEKRARELLEIEYRREETAGALLMAGCLRDGETHGFEVELRAIIAALTPPEGYVLVPVATPIPEMWAIIKGDGLASIDLIDGYQPESARHQHLGWFQLAWPELLAMLAARPEVKP